MANRRTPVLNSMLVLSRLGAVGELRASIQVTGTPLVLVNAVEPSTSSGDFSVEFFVDDDRTVDMIDGASTNTTRYSIADSWIRLEFDHLITGQAGSRALSELDISFHSTIDVPFVIGGSYAAMHPDGREMGLAARLCGATTVIDMQSLSESTPDEALIVGESGGDTFNRTQGGLTGILRADVEYRLGLIATSSSQSPTAHDAHARGHITLAFVPEPGTAVLVGLGLTGLASRRRL